MNAFVTTLFGLALIGSPIALRASGHPLGTVESALLMSVGVLVVAGATLLSVLTRLYQRTRASEAFVRTGLGGARVVRDGGALVVPFVHELVKVSLQTIKLELARENEDALITRDKLRADVRAEFFVRVQPDAESILQASRSLGDRMSRPAEVNELVEDKLVSALRTAAASRTLEELNSERDDFLADVIRLVGEDLRSNGLVLETVTISRLDQTDERFLRDGNIFDAQGRRKIAEITQVNLTERNRLVREGEQVRKHQDVAARQQLLVLERTEQEAEAKLGAEVQRVRAHATRDAHLEQIAAKEKVEVADLERRRVIELAARLQEQSVEVAEREKQERIAEAERRRAVAERALAEAEVERERVRQQIETVRVREDAERAKAQCVLAAEAQAETAFVSERRRADGEAYALERQAEARRLAADAEAEAIRKRADAEAEAERARAGGELARAMIPVDVRRAEVAVERDRIDTVVTRELEAREKHGRVAQEFELGRMRIEAEKEVRVALANAHATLFAKVQATLYGTPEDVARMSESLLRGHGAAATVEGFLAHLGPDARTTVGRVGDAVADVAGALAARAANSPGVGAIIGATPTEDERPPAALRPTGS